MSRALDPEIAVAFSAEPWVEQLHRYCSDHGGARVCQLVMDPILAVEERFDAFVVSHRWPGLTVGLVDALHTRGRVVVGVFDDAHGETLLRSIGVDALIEADSAPEEFVAVLGATVDARPSAAIPGSAPALESAAAPLVVIGGPAGSGATEVAIGLAHAIGRRATHVVLVDADLGGASVAPRLALALEPNLATAVDAVEHGLGRLGDVWHDGGEGVAVVGGVAGRGLGAGLRAAEIGRVLGALEAVASVVIVDIGPNLAPGDAMLGDAGSADVGAPTAARALLAGADAAVVVGHGAPTGLVAVSAWLADARRLAPAVPVHLVLNRVPRDRYRRRELLVEATHLAGAASLTLLPYDRAVVDAGWAGTAVGRGPWRRGIRALAATIAPPTRSAHRTRPTRRATGVRA